MRCCAELGTARGGRMGYDSFVLILLLLHGRNPSCYYVRNRLDMISLIESWLLSLLSDFRVFGVARRWPVVEDVFCRCTV